MSCEDVMTCSIHAEEHLPTHSCTSIISRIEWCQRQISKSDLETELEEWCAEKEGLTDALLNRDCTYKYHYRPSRVCERYELGLEDGRALICVASVESIWQPAI